MRQFENKSFGFRVNQAKQDMRRHFVLRHLEQVGKRKQAKKARDAYRAACGIEPKERE